MPNLFLNMVTLTRYIEYRPFSLMKGGSAICKITIIYISFYSQYLPDTKRERGKFPQS